MANSNNEENQHNMPPAEQSQSVNQGPDKKQPQGFSSKTPRSVSFFMLLLFIISIGALMGSGYEYYQIKRLLREQANPAKSHSLQQAKMQMTSIIDGLKQEQTQLKSHFNALQQTMQASLNKQPSQPQDLSLLQVRYLLQLAQINAKWGSSQANTRSMLEEADALLPAGITNQPIKQAIQEDIAAMNALPVVDVDGLLTQLESIKTAIPKLAFKNPVFDKKPTEAGNAEKKEGPAWKAHLNASLELLKQMIIVRHHPDDAQPLFTPLLQTMIREKLAMSLQTAQWAVLQANTFLYQQALTQFTECVIKNVDPNDAETKRLLDELATLQQTTITPIKPTPGKALFLVNQLIEGKKDISSAYPSPTPEKAND